jgi:pimeloyl-ACP methyl ester carboxylesterase
MRMWIWGGAKPFTNARAHLRQSLPAKRSGPMQLGILFALLLISFLAALLRMSGRYRADLQRAHERLVAGGSRIAKTPCGLIEYATSGTGVPVLELHGVFGGFDQGLLIARPVLRDEFHIIAPSRFGYLGTPMPGNASPARQADAYACLLDHLGIRQVVVMSHSAGSVSAMQLALRHPERVAALVLVTPAAPGPEPAAPPRLLIEALFRTDAIVWLLKTYFPTTLPIGVPRSLTLTPDDVDEIEKIVEILLPVASRRDGFLFDMYVSTPTVNAGTWFSEISIPTLVITAADDPLALPGNARSLVEAIPAARLVELDRGGHLLLGQSDVIRKEITGFIREHYSGR